MGDVVKFKPVFTSGEIAPEMMPRSDAEDYGCFYPKQSPLVLFAVGLSVGTYIGLWLFVIVALVRSFHG